MWFGFRLSIDCARCVVYNKWQGDVGNSRFEVSVRNGDCIDGFVALLADQVRCCSFVNQSCLFCMNTTSQWGNRVVMPGNQVWFFNPMSRRASFILFWVQ